MFLLMIDYDNIECEERLVFIETNRWTDSV